MCSRKLSAFCASGTSVLPWKRNVVLSENFVSNYGGPWATRLGS